MSKEQLLAAAQAHVAEMQTAIAATQMQKGEQVKTLTKQARTIGTSDSFAYAQLATHYREQTEGLAELAPAPYFARCDFGERGAEKSYYIGKFSFTEQGIYSWVTPVAQLRFENPGPAAYHRVNGSVKSGNLARKDSYLIVDGAIKFFATEREGLARELIYQENFTRQKSDFVLPEIVALMEKAQDQVIRADWHGPFVISGPAGSGKTTLALHRIAYLLQAPETAEYFSTHNILVLVQDAGSRAYFEHLLPDLGIRGVHIQTFSDWAAQILELTNWQLAEDDYSEAGLQYAQAKLHALRQLTTELGFNKKIYQTLQAVYQAYFDETQIAKFKKQQLAGILDRVDLTVLLTLYRQAAGELSAPQEYWQELQRGGHRKKVTRLPIKYNLMVIDEFQNYLPEQVALLKGTLNARIQSMIYVGDLGQQTRLGTMQDWQSIDEAIPNERIVRLHKVYRNTRQILEYVRECGYAVEIPAQIKIGPAVVEVDLATTAEMINYIKNNTTPGTFGAVLMLDSEQVRAFKSGLADCPTIRCLSFVEAQGLEFDEVFVVKTRAATTMLDDSEFAIEVAKIYRDLEYVALTRAMNRMVILK